MAIFHQLTEGQASRKHREAHDVGAVYKAKRGKLVDRLLLLCAALLVAGEVCSSLVTQPD
jgi:hypothetical protein